MTTRRWPPQLGELDSTAEPRWTRLPSYMGASKSLAYRDPSSRHGKVRPVAGKAKMIIDRSFREETRLSRRNRRAIRAVCE